jgi:RimJ/RimL family protein N-acetyltransferase
MFEQPRLGAEWQPLLIGELLEIRPLEAGDFDALYAVASDPLIWEQHPARDRWQEPVFRELFAESMASGGAMLVIERATGQVIGSSRYFNHEPARRTIEVGWSFLARAYWGGTYNREMKRLMLGYAYQHVDVVELLIGENNLRSRKAAEKIGAKLLGPRTNHYGRISVVYALSRDDFAKHFAE